MIHDPAAVQVSQKILDLVDRDRVPDADVHPSALLERAAAVDPDQLPPGIEQRPTGVSGVDRGVGLKAIGVFQERSGGILIAVNARDDPLTDGRVKVGRQQKRVAHRETGFARFQRIAVAHFRRRKIVSPKQLDQCHVARGIHADNDRVVELAIVQSAAAGSLPHGWAT